MLPLIKSPFHRHNSRVRCKQSKIMGISSRMPTRVRSLLPEEVGKRANSERSSNQQDGMKMVSTHAATITRTIVNRSGDYTIIVCSAHGKFMTQNPRAPCPRCSPPNPKTNDFPGNRTRMV